MNRYYKKITFFFILLCFLFTLAGCKIEFPDQVNSQISSSQQNVSSSTESTAISSENSAVSSLINSETSTSSQQTEQKASSALNQSSPTASSKLSTTSKAINSKPSTSSKSTASHSAPATSEKETFTCTLMISCKTVLNHFDKLSEAEKKIIPSDGMIYPTKSVTVKKGESVFDVLLRETKSANIHLDFNTTPALNSKYIKGIGNLGKLNSINNSGWLYSVNGEFPNVGCNAVKLKDGDKIEWHYTCDLGRDLL